MNELIQKRVVLDKALFTLSIDTELAWGTFDDNGLELYRHHYSKIREVITRLLELLNTYGIPATWAVVGHLFLRSCSRTGPDNHSHVLQPTYSWYPQGWLSHDPFSNVDEDPFFYAPDIIDRIVTDPLEHDIGCHSFSHAILGDPECTREVAYSQLQECRRLAEAQGIDMVSLVFPRDSIGHVDVVCQLGFSSFRGVQRTWHRTLDPLSKAARLGHFFDKMLAVTPPCYKEFSAYGCGQNSHHLIDIPSSMFYPSFEGMWRAVGLSRRILQARKGIEEAIRRRAMFHLWFHPVNLASSPLLFDGLENIFEFLATNVQAGNIEPLTMAQTASYLNDKMERDR